MYQADYETGEIFLYDAIGDPYWGMIGAENVISDLAKMGGKRVTMRIATPGGSVNEGKLMYNALKRYRGGVDTVVDSNAYSIGSYVFLAGQRRVVAQNAVVMIHKPWTKVGGNAAQLRETADILDKFESSVIGVYAEISGKTRSQIEKIMAGKPDEDGTWYTAQEAVDAGFATEIGDILPGGAPTFAKAMYGGKPDGEALNQPHAGSRTRWTIASREIRLQQIKAMFGR